MSGDSEEEEDCYSPDRDEESLDGLENDDIGAQWNPSKASSSKVYMQ